MWIDFVKIVQYYISSDISYVNLTGKGTGVCEFATWEHLGMLVMLFDKYQKILKSSWSYDG